MPSGVFKPYSGVSTGNSGVHQNRRRRYRQRVAYNMEADGFRSMTSATPMKKNNDIPDIIERWANLGGEPDRERTEKSFLVPKQEIARKRVRLQLLQVHRNRLRAYGVPAYKRSSPTSTT